MRLAIVLALLIFGEVFCDNDLRVLIKNGWLQGKVMKSLKGREIHGFLSIPFAKPPLGDLRFKEPQAPDDWEGIKDATEMHDMCLQRNLFIHSKTIDGTEDCLYLNVYRPKDFKNKLLPVMVFFHGGAWLAGSGNTINYGPDMLLDKDVILVSPNYRLGPLGFLSTEDLVVPGNNGMKDQSFALKWVQENIDKFGGDPNRVTIFGESAGGASVHYHTLSPLSKGLFHRIIAESGTAFCPWAFFHKGVALKNAQKLSKALKCPTETSKAMVDCLRKIDANDIIAQDVLYMKYGYDPMIPFRPIAEVPHKGAFIDDSPLNLVKSGRLQDVPIMNGFNTEEGALKSCGLFEDKQAMQVLANDFTDYLAVTIQFDHSKNVKKIAQKLKKYYLDGIDKYDKSHLSKFTDLYTDGWFLQGIDQLNILHEKYTNSPIYYYMFAYRGTASYTEVFANPQEDCGVCHADELQYLFPVGKLLFPHKHLSQKDIEMVDTMTELWVNFAIYGHPTPNVNQSKKMKWEPFKSSELNYLYIGGDVVEMRSELLKERILLWRELQEDINDGSNVNYHKDEL